MSGKTKSRIAVKISAASQQLERQFAVKDAPQDIKSSDKFAG